MRPVPVLTALLVTALLGVGGQLAIPAFASEYTIKGSVKCVDILAEDSDPNFREFNKWWLLGYVTARNFEGQRSFGQDVADEELYQMGLDFCRGNRERDWDDAAQDVYQRLAL